MTSLPPKNNERKLCLKKIKKVNLVCVNKHRDEPGMLKAAAGTGHHGSWLHTWFWPVLFWGKPLIHRKAFPLQAPLAGAAIGHLGLGKSLQMV